MPDLSQRALFFVMLVVLALGSLFLGILVLIPSPQSVRAQARETERVELEAQGFVQRQTRAQERQATALENIARELARLRADCR